MSRSIPEGTPVVSAADSTGRVWRMTTVSGGRANLAFDDLDTRDGKPARIMRRFDLDAVTVLPHDRAKTPLATGDTVEVEGVEGALVVAALEVNQKDAITKVTVVGKDGRNVTIKGSTVRKKL